MTARSAADHGTRASTSGTSGDLRIFLRKNTFRRTVTLDRLAGEVTFGRACFESNASFEQIEFGDVSFEPLPIERMSAVRARVGARSMCQLPAGWGGQRLDDHWVGLMPNV
ncbi:hypothetical protein ACFYO1_12645 [Nocardia sp. NPDC006044]|uniref:hypothetical protein n=1 Tax=Nocardia sp. NPDC006044 TaxID=3364306 RepID=UPI0036A3A8C9